MRYGKRQELPQCVCQRAVTQLQPVFPSMLLHPQRASLMWSAEKDVLKKRMADSEAENVVSILT